MTVSRIVDEPALDLVLHCEGVKNVELVVIVNMRRWS